MNNEEDKITILEEQIRKLFLSGCTAREITEILNDMLVDVGINSETYKFKYVLGTTNRIWNYELDNITKKRVEKAREERKKEPPKDYLKALSPAKKIEQLELKAVKLYTTTSKSVKKIVEEMTPEITEHYSRDEFLRFSLVNNAIMRFLGKLTPEQKEELNLRRKQIKMASSKPDVQKQKAIADKIYVILQDLMKTNNNNRKSLSKATSTVSEELKITYAEAQQCFKTYYKEIYDNIAKRFYKVDYLISIANKIIEKDITRNVAIQLEGFASMMDYIKDNRPDLYIKVKEVFASHDDLKKPHFSDKRPLVIKSEYNEMVAKIAVEYRVSLKTLCEFINENRYLFLRDQNSVITEDELKPIIEKYIANLYGYNARDWYIADADDLDNRLSRFKKFAEEFIMLGDNTSQIKRFVDLNTAIDLNTVLTKVTTANKGEVLKFTPEELRAVAKYVIRYALTDSQLDEVFESNRFRKDVLAQKLLKNNTEEDQLLINDINNLNDYLYVLNRKELSNIKGR